MAFASTARYLIWIKTTSIILHHKVQIRIVYGERHKNMLCLCMVTGISQGLLGDAVDTFLQARR